MGILKRIACVASFRRMCILCIAIAAALMLAVTAVAFTLVQDAYEPDDTVGQAEPLVLGAAKQARTLHYNPPTGDVDWVSFSATAGTSYVIQTGDLDPDTTDTVLRLYDTDGSTLLAENDDYGFSFASRIAWKAPASGTYYVRVSGRHSGISGSYTLELRQAGALTGRVTRQGTTMPLADITVDLWQYDQDGYYAMFETKTDADGNYSFDAVPAGTWRVGFYDWDQKAYSPKFYNNRNSVDQATDVQVQAGVITTGIDASLAPIDTTPPTTTLSGVPAGWTTQSPVIFSLAATDDSGGSGVEATYYKLGGGAYVAYTGPVSVGAEGSQVLEYYSVDRAGNAETPKTSTIRIDVTPPVTSSDAKASYTGSASITLAAQDGLSGVASTMWRVDGGTWQAYASAIGIGSPGTYVLEYYSVDTAGNTETAKTASFTVVAASGGGGGGGGGGDTVAPVTTSNAAVTYDNAATITLSATDGIGGSGVAATHYRLNGGVQLTYTAPITVAVAGTHTLSYWSVDVAGNIETAKTATFTVRDTVAPVTTSNAKAAYDDAATITLSATDNTGGSGVAATYWRIDGGAQTPYTGPVNVTGAGLRTLSYWSVDAAGNTEAAKHVTFSIRASATVFESVAGDDRYQTAVAASVAAYPSALDPAGPRTVVIATGANWPDALGGTALAGALDAPVLLVSRSSVPSAVLAEIVRLGARKAIIVGGTAAVGASVETELAKRLSDGVERISGDDRYETADAVAARVIKELGTGFGGAAFVATGADFPDALAAAPAAAALGRPLFLAHPRRGLSQDTKAAMAPVTDVVVLGGTGAVSSAVQSELADTLSGSVERISGADRYVTAAAVAAWAASATPLRWDGVAIATGADFPDALAGGVLQGKRSSVMLLTRRTVLSPAASDALESNKGSISTVTFLGGTGAVSQSVRDAVMVAFD